VTPTTDPLNHQALCVTDDEDGVGAALARVLSDRTLVSALVGPDADVTVDLMPLPAQLAGRLVPGTTSISLAVDDLEARVAACRAAGLDVTVGIGPGDLPYAVVTASGLEFELVGFGA
jgi:orotate phosphoribosyltransferase-like protein